MLVTFSHYLFLNPFFFLSLHIHPATFSLSSSFIPITLFTTPQFFFLYMHGLPLYLFHVFMKAPKSSMHPTCHYRSHTYFSSTPPLPSSNTLSYLFLYLHSHARQFTLPNNFSFHFFLKFSGGFWRFQKMPMFTCPCREIGPHDDIYVLKFIAQWVCIVRLYGIMYAYLWWNTHGNIVFWTVLITRCWRADGVGELFDTIPTLTSLKRYDTCSIEYIGIGEGSYRTGLIHNEEAFSILLDGDCIWLYCWE